MTRPWPMPPWSAGILREYRLGPASVRRYHGSVSADAARGVAPTARTVPAHWRRLDDAEQAALAEAIRFGPAFAGAIHFERALIDGVPGTIMDARLARLRNWIAVSQAVADIAARHLGAR